MIAPCSIHVPSSQVDPGGWGSGGGGEEYFMPATNLTTNLCASETMQTY